MAVLKDRHWPRDRTFFTSDTHFGHANIIKYCDRPFNDTVEMNDFLVDRWNAKVPKDGIVFHLGDFALTMSKGQAQRDIFDQLNGDKYLIYGNHESIGDRMIGWKGFYDIAEINILDPEISYGKQHIVMCHYPMIVWNASHRGSWQLFGHVHGGLSNKGVHKPTQLDVGVDLHAFEPLSYQEVKEIITKQALSA